MAIDITWPEVNSMRWDVPLKANVQAIADAADAVTETVENGRLSETALETTIETVVETNANVFTQTQTFDTNNGFAIGNKLQLKFVDGFFGQRLHLTGLPQAPGQPDIMPYLEVVPTTQTGTDVGGAIAGVQVYRTLGGGGVPNREFLAIEASGNLASSVGFKIATWASGTGQVQPIRFVIGSDDIVTMEAPSGVTPRMRVASGSQIYSLGANPLFFERESGLSALRARVAADANSGPWTFMGRNRGTRLAPAAPVGGDILGEHRFGSLDTSTGAEVPSALIRALATENWAYGTDQGTLLRFRLTPNDSASMVDVFELKDPTDPNDTAFMVLVNRSGVKTISRVAIGPVDSGGTGFRTLRVAN